MSDVHRTIYMISAPRTRASPNTRPQRRKPHSGCSASEQRIRKSALRRLEERRKTPVHVGSVTNALATLPTAVAASLLCSTQLSLLP